MVLGFLAYDVVCFLSRTWCRCLLEQAIGSLLLGWAELVLLAGQFVIWVLGVSSAGDVRRGLCFLVSGRGVRAAQVALIPHSRGINT